MSEKDKEEFRNAIRRIGYCSVRLESPYDRVRVSEWIRKLVLMDDDNYDNIKKRNDYIQYLKIQVSHGIIQLPFSKPPPESDLPTLPQMLGNTICSRVPDLPKTGPISPAIIHKSPDGRAYISIKHVPGDGVLCYMAVTPNPDELKNKEQRDNWTAISEVAVISVSMMVGLGCCCSSVNNCREWIGEFSAEFLGTFLLVFMGNAAVAEAVLSNGKGGNTLTVYIGYGLGLFLGILVSGGVSGGHLNPAVTVAGAIVGKFKRFKVFHYLIAQYFGAFVASALTYLVYIDSFQKRHLNYGMNKTTASIFATYPKDDLTIFGSMIDQILGSMILVIAIYAVTDKNNAKVPLHLGSLYVSLTLIGIACSLGINQGFAVNPARDLSPRFFTYIAGWGPNVFSSGTYWYVPIIGPHIGALVGALIYISLIEKPRQMEIESEFYLPPPEIKDFGSHIDPIYSIKDGHPYNRREMYMSYL